MPITVTSNGNAITVTPNSNVRAQVMYQQGSYTRYEHRTISVLGITITLSGGGDNDQMARFILIPQEFSSNTGYTKPYPGCLISIARQNGGAYGWAGYYMSGGVISTNLGETGDPPNVNFTVNTDTPVVPNVNPFVTSNDVMMTVTVQGGDNYIVQGSNPVYVSTLNNQRVGLTLTPLVLRLDNGQNMKSVVDGDIVYDKFPAGIDINGNKTLVLNGKDNIPH